MMKKPVVQSPDDTCHWRARSLVLIMMCVLLSVRLLQAQPIISFNAHYMASSVYFTWELSPNTLYQELAIERSSDQQIFFTCLSLNSTNSRINAWDKTPLPGTSWYRLRLTELNGSVIYSPLVMVINPGKIKVDPVTWQNRQEISNVHIITAPVNKLFIFEINGNLREIRNFDLVNNSHPECFLTGIPSGKPFLLMVLDGNGKVTKKIITGIN